MAKDYLLITFGKLREYLGAALGERRGSQTELISFPHHLCSSCCSDCAAGGTDVGRRKKYDVQLMA